MRTMMTKEEIADATLSMALAMGDLALDMRPYWPDKAHELLHAAEIAQSWANGMYDDIGEEA